MQYVIEIQNKAIGTDINSVNAKELHNFIQSKSRFNDWIKNRITKYGFTENQDYIIVTTSTGGRPSKEYYITLDMAKELSMVENNEKGREARRWFIAVEKQAPGQSEEVLKLQETILLQNTIIADLQNQLPNTSNNTKLEVDNRNLKRALIQFSDRYNKIVQNADNQIEAMRKELLAMTNVFQQLPSLANDGKNLNTDTEAGHSHW